MSNWFFADELDEVHRHQGLLRELQKLADDGTHEFTLPQSDVVFKILLLKNP